MQDMRIQTSEYRPGFTDAKSTVGDMCQWSWLSPLLPRGQLKQTAVRQIKTHHRALFQNR